MKDPSKPFAINEAPLVKTIPASGISALELYAKIDWRGQGFLFEGSKGGWFDGDFSLLGGFPFGIFQSKGKTSRFDCFISGKTQTTTKRSDPIATLQSWLDLFQIKTTQTLALPKIPFVFSGVLGFFSYELAHQFEKIPQSKESSGLPDIYLLFQNFHITMDHRKDLIYLVYNPAPEIRMGGEPKKAHQKGQQQIETLAEKILDSESTHQKSSHKSAAKIIERSNVEAVSNCSAEAYMKMVHRAKAFISAGDIFQANLSHQFHASSPFDSLFGLYRRLWQINPSPFSCYLNLGEIEIASGSPERLVRIKKDEAGYRLETRPIAGTKPRGASPEEDQVLIEALYQSKKERAEHLMMVDLERNDLGKVCEYGSVSVDEFMTLEKYSHVFHLVSHISGRLKPMTPPLQVLKALFPGGTITGVPKIRCMEIISALEQRARGIYTGSIGYIGFDGEMDLNIAIRTWVKQGETMSFQVGAGIVADSDPEKEYEETLHKAEALIKALHPAAIAN